MKDTFICCAVVVGVAEGIGDGLEGATGSVVVMGAVEGSPGMIEGKACWQPTETMSETIAKNVNNDLGIFNLYLSKLMWT